MVRRTGHDALRRMFGPVAATLLSDQELAHRRAAEYAINADGRINQRAIPPDTNRFTGFVREHTGVSTASTSVWASVVSIPVTLPAGRWRVTGKSMARIGNTSGSSVDNRINVGPQFGTTRIHTAPSSYAAPCFLMEQLEIDGDQDLVITVQIKSNSAGTSTMAGVVLEYEAVRL